MKMGAWRVIGRGPVVTVPQLVFRVAIGSIHSIYLESYDGSKRREATPAEGAQVPNRTSVSPKVVEHMFLASHGLGHWDESYVPHTIEAIQARARLL